MNNAKGQCTLLKEVIVCLLIAALTYNVKSIQMIGMGAAAIALALLVLAYTSAKNWKISIGVFVPAGVLLLVYLVSIARSNSVDSIEKAFSLLYSLCLLVSLSRIDINVSDKFMRGIFFVICIVLMIPISSASAYNVIDGGYKSIYTTTTFMGIFSCLLIEYCYLCYFKSKNKIWWIYMIILAVWVWNSKVRTAYIGLLLILAVALANCINLIPKLKKGVLKTGEYLTWTIIVAFTIIYPNLERFSWYQQLSTVVYSVTGKILMSGRNVIWKEAFDLIMDSPLLGYGMDITDKIGISVHNSYIQCMLQFGLIGTIAVVVLIHEVLSKMMKNKCALTTVIYIFTLINLLMSTTEVMMLQGQLIIQILIWALMGIGMNKKLE